MKRKTTKNAIEIDKEFLIKILEKLDGLDKKVKQHEAKQEIPLKFSPKQFDINITIGAGINTNEQQEIVKKVSSEVADLVSKYNLYRLQINYFK